MKDQLVSSRLETGRDHRQWLGRLLIVGGIGLSLGYLSFVRYGITREGIITALYCWYLLLLAFIDLDLRLVPTPLIALGIPLGLAGSLGAGVPQPLSALLGAVVGYGLFWIIARARPGAMGAGDVRLAGLIGMMVGASSVLVALLTGMIIAGLVALVLVLSKRARLDETMAYGAYLVVGAWIMLLWG